MTLNQINELRQKQMQAQNNMTLNELMAKQGNMPGIMPGMGRFMGAAPFHGYRARGKCLLAFGHFVYESVSMNELAAFVEGRSEDRQHAHQQLAGPFWQEDGVAGFPGLPAIFFAYGLRRISSGSEQWTWERQPVQPNQGCYAEKRRCSLSLRRSSVGRNPDDRYL